MPNVHRGPVVTAVKAEKATRSLRVTFADGTEFQLPWEYLRVHSPSAEVQGHGNPKIVAHKKEVAISAIEPVGNYAIKPIFSDGHESGLYSWQYLYELGSRQAELWQDYLNKLASAGVDRDQPMAPKGGGACGHHH